MHISIYTYYIYSATVKPDLARDARRKLKEERQKKKERKRNRKAKMEKECLAERMNCFRYVGRIQYFKPTNFHSKYSSIVMIILIGVLHHSGMMNHFVSA